MPMWCFIYFVVMIIHVDSRGARAHEPAIYTFITRPPITDHTTVAIYSIRTRAERCPCGGSFIISMLNVRCCVERSAMRHGCAEQPSYIPQRPAQRHELHHLDCVRHRAVSMHSSSRWQFPPRCQPDSQRPVRWSEPNRPNSSTV